MNGNAIWLTCRDCGHTSRVLALMAGRVLKTRTQCPGCASTAVPCFNSTPIGTAIALSDEQSAALREMDDPALHRLVDQTAGSTPREWMHQLQSRVVDRFSRRRRYGSHHTHHPNAAAPFGAQQNEAFHPVPGTIRPTGTAARL